MDLKSLTVKELGTVIKVILLINLILFMQIIFFFCQRPLTSCRVTILLKLLVLVNLGKYWRGHFFFVLIMSGV
jgi:hypothetical protein